MLIEERDAATKGMALAARQAELATAQQSEAAEREDFELADKLAGIIDKHAADEKEQERILHNINLAVKELDAQREDVMKGLTQCFVDVQMNLRQFKNEREELEKNNGKKVNDKFQTTSKRLAAEEERLGMDLKHLERDEGLVEEERKELEGTIQEQTSDMEKLRDQAKERLERVNEEIQDLRALLEAKENLAAELQSDFAAQETAISKIRSKFSRQLARLENKLTALKANRKEWESEKQHHDHLKSSHESAIKAHSEALTAHEEMMKIIQEEISTAEKVEEIIVSEIVEAETREAADEASSELRELQADVLKCEAAADEANQVLMAAKATVSNLRDELD